MHLEKISSPADFRHFSIEKLNELSTEVRERILSVISETGGHLASSLGAVELTVALHFVYNTPHDKIIWDVGHQCYAHKILTGRNALFPTIRQHNGLSGFPRASESPYDTFDVGHASTSISVALGLVQAREINRQKFDVIAVIGDGSMTGGLAYEGLNNAGVLKKNMIVILNDNKMSISPNVGAMSSYLTKLLTDPRYNKLKADIWEVTGRFKRFGDRLRIAASRVEESLKGLLLPGRLFEDLGFRYFGPIDGHNIDEMIRTFRNIRENVQGPVLIHVITKKGKGYNPAETNSAKFHGVGAFEKETGETVKAGPVPTYSAVFGRTLVKLAEADSRVVGITAAMPTGTGMELFAQKFPGRYFDAGIAEGHAVTFAGGLAKGGLKPVVALYSTFLQRALDNIIHDVALQKLNVLFCLDRGGLTPDDGPTHHGAFDMSFLRSIPDAVIMSPKDENELQHMMYTGLRCEGPVFIRYPRGVGTGVALDESFREIQIGSFEEIAHGKDGLILALGEMVERAQQVRDALKEKGFDIAVINARFVKPLVYSELEE
ncbi:MAG: 1-deoxy-D-xylulose-5-phosphate synthase, partial [Fibrobacterota bacterium]